MESQDSGERLGTSPVSSAYLKMVGDEDILIRDMLMSSATTIKEVSPEEDDAIWFEMSDDGDIVQSSKGCREFFGKIAKEFLSES